MMGKAVAGEIDLPENYKVKASKKTGWNFEEEIKELRTQGQMVNAVKRMEELMIVPAKTDPEMPIAIVGDPQEVQREEAL
jgi:hypothetical protein